MNRFMISAAHKSSGKTTVALGLAAALRQRGLTVQPFKKGPDYIDPIWLSLAAGRPCRNLDYHMMSPGEIDDEFSHHGTKVDVAVIEGNKGLHDGLALDGVDSNAALATQLAAPVILVLDVRGTIRGIAPLVLGYQAFDPSVNIAGVILNHVGGARHEGKLRAVMDAYTDVPVVGAVARNPDMVIVERHLGLVPGNEVRDAQNRINAIAAAITGQVELDRIMTIAQSAPTLPPRELKSHDTAVAPSVRIAVARDAAFGFYYPGDLEELTRFGAQLVFFDALNDRALPPCDGLFIGGGFPETHLDALAANRELRTSIRAAVAGGLPTYAECGGLMYLCRSLSWNGATAHMVGAIPADAVMNARPRGKGYVELCETGASPWPGAQSRIGEVVPGHEFHYSQLENLDETGLSFAYQVKRGTGISDKRDGLVRGNLLATYCHLKSSHAHPWAKRFVAQVRASL